MMTRSPTMVTLSNRPEHVAMPMASLNYTHYTLYLYRVERVIFVGKLTSMKIFPTKT